MCFPGVIRSSYDNIAGMYEAFWGNWYFPAAKPALHKLFFDVVKPGSRVLDVCCGSGHVAREFVPRGYRITGVDQSSELIAIARKNLPGSVFYVGDVRRLSFKQEFDAAYSTFDALNHLLSLSDLYQAFGAIRQALRSKGLFVFDMNLEEAYFADSRQWTAMVEDSDIGLVRGTYDRETKLATTDLIWFARTRRKGLWEERRSTIQERCYTQSEITDGLLGAGFSDLRAVSAADLGVTADLGYGRMFFSVRA